MNNMPKPRPWAGTQPGRISMKYDTTNKEFAEKDTNFNNLCSKLGVKATSRQASKFRNKKGDAYKNKHKVNNNE